MAVVQALAEICTLAIPLAQLAVLEYTPRHVGRLLPERSFLRIRSRAVVCRLRALYFLAVRAHGSIPPMARGRILALPLACAAADARFRDPAPPPPALSRLVRRFRSDRNRGTWNSGFLATEAGSFGRFVGDLAITLMGLMTLEWLDVLLFVPAVILVRASYYCRGTGWRHGVEASHATLTAWKGHALCGASEKIGHRPVVHGALLVSNKGEQGGTGDGEAGRQRKKKKRCGCGRGRVNARRR